MDEYPDILDKLALAVESAKVAKAFIVSTEGMGEDLNFTLMGWRGSQLVVVAQMSYEHMADKEARLEKLVNCALIVRQGWEVDAFTFVAEGYCSLDGKASEGKDMAQLFSLPEADFVKECLSFVHAEEGDDDDDVLYAVVPYEYRPPRRVLFSDPLRHGGSRVLRDPRYSAVLVRALRMGIEEAEEDLDVDVLQDFLAVGIEELGFLVNYRNT